MENKMKYIINYTNEGKILGFYNENQPSNLNVQVDNQTWINNMGMTKIIIDKDKNITFEKVDWKTPEEIEVERVQLIKAKAGEIIKSKYSTEWQLNHPRLDETYISQYAWIDNIRKISNEAEANMLVLEDIDWGIQ